MNWKRILSMLLFCVAAASFILACSVTGLPFTSQAEPTVTRRTTRVARATFTPRPQVTDTPIPEPTDEPTEAPTDVPTDVPVTVAPTKKPAAPKAMNPPAPPTNPPQPTAPPATTNPYRYSFIRSECTHSGGTHIFVVVYSDYKNPNSQLAGARVIASYAPDSPAFGEQVGETNSDGVFDYVMSADGSAWEGTAYAWVVDKDNRRISEIGGPLQLNRKGPDEAGTCWHAKFYFAAGK